MAAGVLHMIQLARLSRARDSDFLLARSLANSHFTTNTKLKLQFI